MILDGVPVEEKAAGAAFSPPHRISGSDSADHRVHENGTTRPVPRLLPSLVGPPGLAGYALNPTLLANQQREPKPPIPNFPT